MTRIVVLPSDESACGWYRMRLPVGAVRQVRPEWDIKVYRPRDVKLGTGAQGELWGVQGLDLSTCDLLIMQRVATRAQAELLRWAQTQNIATIVDSDDAMWCIDPANIAWPSWNEGAHHWRWIDTAAEIVDLTTVTTPALARRYGKHGRTEVLPNCVPQEISTHVTSIRGELDPTVTVGWAGFTATHPGDLTMVGDAVRRVQAETGCLLRVVGDAEGAARDWGVVPTEHPPVPCTECDHASDCALHNEPALPIGPCNCRTYVEQVQPQPIGVPYYTALTTLDIGLVPLKDTPFNRAKSYLKALEFAATGVAVVASSTPANVALSKIVPILLADHPNQWYDAITLLVQSREFRLDRVEEARAAALAHCTYEGNAEKWAAVWERAIARRTVMSA